MIVFFFNKNHLSPTGGLGVDWLGFASSPIGRAELTPTKVTFEPCISACCWYLNKLVGQTHLEAPIIL